MISKDKSPKYEKLYQELPSGIDGYTINLGKTKKEWHIFVCNSKGVPVVVESCGGKLTAMDAYAFAAELIERNFGRKNHKENEQGND